MIIQLKAKPHEAFERSGNDLLTRVKITLSEALTGFSRILVTHLDGRGVRVSSPRNKIIKPDETIILRGEGMPIHKHPDEKGDLYVVLALEMPSDSWLDAVDKQVSVWQAFCLIFLNVTIRHSRRYYHRRSRT